VPASWVLYNLGDHPSSTTDTLTCAAPALGTQEKRRSANRSSSSWVDASDSRASLLRACSLASTGSAAMAAAAAAAAASNACCPSPAVTTAGGVVSDAPGRVLPGCGSAGRGMAADLEAAVNAAFELSPAAVYGTSSGLGSAFLGSCASPLLPRTGLTLFSADSCAACHGDCSFGSQVNLVDSQ
jgi:hypothetical protein